MTKEQLRQQLDLWNHRTAAATAQLIRDYRMITKNVEQDAGQPATRPESKSEGSDKPQPESEGRSR
jgi:hypothetical protein